VFRELLLECHDLLLELVLGALTAVLETVLVHLEDRAETVRPVKHGTVELYVLH